MSLITREKVTEMLTEVTLLSQESVPVHRDCLKEILSELHVLRHSLAVSESDRIAAVKGFTLQAAMIWFIGFVNDIKQADREGLTADDLLDLMIYRMTENLNDAQKLNDIVAGKA